MSRLYGERRIVLAARLSANGKKLVSQQGGKSYIPLGWWYEENGAYCADLKGALLTGYETKKALREAVAQFAHGYGASKAA